MKIKAQLLNQDLEDSFKVSVNKKTKNLDTKDKEINFEVDNNDEVLVQIEFLRNDIQTIKNPIGRFFAYLLFFVLSIVIFVVDNDTGIETHKFFCDAKPFNLKKTVKIKPKDEVLQIKYIPSKYDKARKMFFAPDIELYGAEVIEESTSCEYSQKYFKKEFIMYHYPSYTILFALTFVLTAFMTNVLINQFSPLNLLGVIGMSFCTLVMLGLMIGLIVLFVFTHRLFREIDLNLSSKFN